MRHIYASVGSPISAQLDPESLAEAAREALAREQRAGSQPPSGPAGSRSGMGSHGTGAGRRSGARSGRGRSGGTGRSQQPNGCRALRRRGG
jgi:hypothetical protein